MRIHIAALAVLVAAGCASIEPSTVAPGDGPADKATKSKKAPTTVPTKKAKPGTASFKDKYIFPDGLEIEVTKLASAKLGAYPVTSDDKGKKGDVYKLFTIRIKNGTDGKLDTVASVEVTYGPDGEEASQVFAGEVGSGIDGTILAGRAKTGRWGFIVPQKYLNDVVLEMSPDFEQDKAIFAGSVK